MSLTAMSKHDTMGKGWRGNVAASMARLFAEMP
jgi:hypothetical protein